MQRLLTPVNVVVAAECAEATATVHRLEAVLHTLDVVEGRIAVDPCQATALLREAIDLLEGTVSSLRQQSQKPPPDE